MIQKHLAKFIEYKDQPLTEEQWIGHNIYSWWEWVSHNLPITTPVNVKSYKLPKNLPVDPDMGRFTREGLKKACNKDSGLCDLGCLISVLAWGGQNRKHALCLFQRYDELQPIIHDMRHGRLSHLEAYDAFYRIWEKPEKLGMGAAYFTKLIFFCEPSHRGYIMDQWTSKSMNLLSGKDIVHLSYGHVSKRNTIKNYKIFCSHTDQLGNELNLKGEEIEIAMFSKGGRKPTEKKHKSEKWLWRDYVERNTKR